MQKLQIFVYKSYDSFQLGLVRNVSYLGSLGLQHGEDALILSPPLVSTEAYQTLAMWERRFARKWGRIWWHIARKQKTYLQPTKEGGRLLDALERVRDVLAGKILAEHRVLNLLRQEGYWPSDISCALDLGVYLGQIQQLPGLISRPWGVQICSRCQSQVTKTVPCSVCGSHDCLLCMKCLPLGEHRSCTTLLALADNRRALSQADVELVLDYELTQAQEQASQKLLQFWNQGQNRALVWAACGAGKTEVTFALIKRVLSEGHEVLFAIPRQDIVREMGERMRKSFPSVDVAVHYGGQPLLASGRLVVATTHQTLNFNRRFQLAILDEVDAFPYQGNEMLRYGLERALCRQGKLVEMTATPSSRHNYNCEITIPARYHGFPLPEPELMQYTLPSWTELESSILPQRLLSTLQDHSHPWLIFAPTIAACTILRKTLADVLEQEVGICHSKVHNRGRVIQNFRAGNLNFLVTTSVLERGVNFPAVGVVVLWADHAVFTTSALVQIAGRVGRTADQPSGTVLFIGSKRTQTMKRALALIRELNKNARERGLLVDESMA